MRSLDDANPRVAALCFFGAIFGPMAAQNPVTAGLSLLGAALWTLVRRDAALLRRGAAGAAVAVLFCVCNPFLQHRGETVLLYSGDNPVTAEALLCGAAAGLALWAVLWWFFAFARIFTSDKIIGLLGGAFPRVSLLLSMSLRYLPLLSRQGKAIRDAQTGVGLYREGDGVAKLRGEAKVFSALVSWSLERGIVTADSMAARGYGTGRRTAYGRFRMRRRDWALLALAALLLAGQIAGLSGGAGYTFYPRIVPPAGAAHIVFEIFCGLAAVLPAVLEGGERARWMRCESRG